MTHEEVFEIFTRIMQSSRNHGNSFISLMVLNLLVRGLFLNSIKAWDHVIVKHVIVPNGDEPGDKTYEHTLHASNVRKEVKNRVTGTRDDLLIKIHLNG